MDGGRGDEGVDGKKYRMDKLQNSSCLDVWIKTLIRLITNENNG